MILTQSDRLIRSFVEQSASILREHLVGIYLHGSAAMGCFNPDKSDIDLIVVVDRPLSDPLKREYMDMVVRVNALGPAKGIEMSVVLGNVCKPFVYPTPFELHFSIGHLEWYKSDPDQYIRRMNGTDKDLAAHFMIINRRGRCLYGAPIRNVFAEVPSDDYMDSIREDIAEAPENIPMNTLYLTLNLARVLAYKEEGLVLSKAEGGEWALSHLPAEFHPLISEALREYSEGVDVIYDGSLARHYADYVIKRIQDQPDQCIPV